MSFPDVEYALRDPDGLLAIGGDLSVERLVAAYRQGIFPWYGPGDPILWWSPDPRTLLIPDELHISRSLRKVLRQGRFHVTMDHDFPAVIAACAAPRDPQGGTWLTPEMIDAYSALHVQGIAHSVEVWQKEQGQETLVGGLYGVAIGAAFFGESMFTRTDNASKVALVHLCERLRGWGFGFVDCQVWTGHLVRMGARQVPRHRFIERLTELRDRPGSPARWSSSRAAAHPTGAKPVTAAVPGDGPSGARHAS